MILSIALAVTFLALPASSSVVHSRYEDPSQLVSRQELRKSIAYESDLPATPMAMPQSPSDPNEPITTPTMHCAGKAPNKDFTCVDGRWTFFSDFSVGNRNLYIYEGASILIEGNLNVNGTGQIHFEGINSKLTVAKCVRLNGRDKKSQVVFNATSIAPLKTRTELRTYISALGNCSGDLQHFKIFVLQAKTCTLTLVRAHRTLASSMNIAFESSKVNCLIIAAIIGTVAGLLVSCLIISGVGLYCVRDKKLTAYRQIDESGSLVSKTPSKIEPDLGLTEH